MELSCIFLGAFSLFAPNGGHPPPAREAPPSAGRRPITTYFHRENHFPSFIFPSPLGAEAAI